MTEHYLSPNALRAQQINDAICQSWQESLAWCFAQPAMAAHREQFESQPLTKSPWPIDFGLYFDLASTLALAANNAGSDVMQGEVKPKDQAEALFGRFTEFNTGSFSARVVHGLSLTTLRPPFFTDSQVECLIRWLDLEPENSMGLSPLSDEELDIAEDHLKQALDALKILCPDFYEEFRVITRQFVMAKPSGQQKLTFGGASSFALWGALALNLDAHPDWWLYLPRLVHEYSHNMLFGFARHEPLVLNDPEERFRSPLRAAERPIDGIYHAAYVSAREALAMKQALERIGQGNLPEQLVRIEDYCQSTLHDSTQAFWDCLSVLHSHARCSDLGGQIMQDVEAQMRNHGLTLDTLITANQPS